MARDKEISSVFARLLPVRQTPWVAAILTFAMAAVLVPIGSVKILAEMSSFAALVAFFAVNVVLIVLRYRMPGHERPFRVPLAVGRLPGTEIHRSASEHIARHPRNVLREPLADRSRSVGGKCR